MTHASLFSGIGGFDLAAQKMGWNNLFQVEIDPFCQKVLAKNFPNATRYTDIRQFDGSAYNGRIDVLSGGFPCQPFSVAGKRNGNADERALWPEMLRVIREVQPAWVVGENVAGIISMELDTVLADLEGIGYTCQAFVVPACAVNALHRRGRVWIVAHAKSAIGEQSGISRHRLAGHSDYGGGHGWTFADTDRERQQQPERLVAEIGGRAEHGGSQLSADTNSPGRKEFDLSAEPERQGFGSGLSPFSIEWQPANSSDLLRAAYGIPGRVDSRAARIKSLGNAIVPQVAYNIFCGISNCC